MSGNICNYEPIINLSIRDINRRLKFIHQYLCFLSSGGGGGAAEGANGLSTSLGGEVVFGQDVGEAGDPAALTSSRQIPLESFSLQFTGADANHYLNINDVGGDGMVVVGGNTFITGTPNSNEIPALRITQSYGDNDAPFVYGMQINASAVVGTGATLWGLQATVANTQGGSGLTTGVDVTTTNSVSSGVVTGSIFTAQNGGSGETRAVMGSAVIVDVTSTQDAIGVYGAAQNDGSGLALGGYFTQPILMEDLGTESTVLVDAAGVSTLAPRPGITIVDSNASPEFGITMRDPAGATFSEFIGVSNGGFFQMVTSLGAGVYISQSDQKVLISPDGSDLSNPEAVLDVRGNATLQRALRSSGVAGMTVNPGDSFKVLTNIGNAGTLTATLPAAQAGLTYTFYNENNNDFVIDAQAGDVIRVGSTVTAAGGSITATNEGDSVTLVAIGEDEWVAISVIGTWT